MGKKKDQGRRLGTKPGEARAMVLKAWRRNGKNISEAARELGCSQNTIRYHLKKAKVIQLKKAPVK